jgi:hypothetical protein
MGTCTLAEPSFVPFRSLDKWVRVTELHCEHRVPEIVPINDKTGASQEANDLRYTKRRD